MRYIFSFLLVGCLLFSATPVGDGFMTGLMGPHAIEINWDPQVLGHKVLISRVHEPEWKIGYRYGVDCKPEDRQNDEALKEAISFSIRRWLEPLKELNPDRPIVDKFVYELQADFTPLTLEELEELKRLPIGELERWRDENLKEIRSVDLQVTFVCTRGASTAKIGLITPPAVFMRLGTEVKGRMLPVLIHEIGHTFGLADTYHREGFMRSRGGLHGTTGIQPASIMSGHVHDGDKLLDNISEDDKRGIIWLYKYVYEDLANDDCIFVIIFLSKSRAAAVPNIH